MNKAVKIAAIMAVMALQACPKKAPQVQEQETPPPAKNQPQWVQTCAGAFSFAQSQEFYGCGAARIPENDQFQLISADERARVDLAKNIDAWVKDLLAGFLAATAIKDNSAATEQEKELFAAKVSREATEIALQGAQSLDRWRAPDGTLHALTKIRFDDLEAAVKKQTADNAELLKIDPALASDTINQELTKRRVTGK